MTRGVEVVRAGALTTLQDTGRPGLAHIGVTRSGALDAASHAAANRAVGNPLDAATLETTLTGVTLRALERIEIAVTGAPSAVFVGPVPAPIGRRFHVAAGQIIEVGAARAGVRAYVAVRGGFAAEPVLGSRATCLLTGVGPAPVADGDVLPVGPADPALDPEPAQADGVPGERVELPFVRGPRDDWFTADAVALLASAAYEVSADSNRVGLRLAGPPLARGRDGELASEGMVLGAIQVPPSGLPIVFLNDHPTTGGYPVVGVVTAEGLGAAAQARPGATVRFSLAR